MFGVSPVFAEADDLRFVTANYTIKTGLDTYYSVQSKTSDIWGNETDYNLICEDPNLSINITEGKISAAQAGTYTLILSKDNIEKEIIISAQDGTAIKTAGNRAYYQNFETAVAIEANYSDLLGSATSTVTEYYGNKVLQINGIGNYSSTKVVGTSLSNYITMVDFMQLSCGASAASSFSMGIRANGGSNIKRYNIAYNDIITYDADQKKVGTGETYTHYRDTMSISGSTANNSVTNWIYGAVNTADRAGLLKRSVFTNVPDERNFKGKFYRLTGIANGSSIKGMLSTVDGEEITSISCDTSDIAMDGTASGQIMFQVHDTKVYMDNVRMYELSNISSLEISPSEISSSVGIPSEFNISSDTQQLYADTLSYEYNKDAVYIDTANGTVTAKTDGEHYITAVAKGVEGGEKRATFKLTSGAVPVIIYDNASAEVDETVSYSLKMFSNGALSDAEDSLTVTCSDSNVTIDELNQTVSASEQGVYSIVVSGAMGSAVYPFAVNDSSSKVHIKGDLLYSQDFEGADTEAILQEFAINSGDFTLENPGGNTWLKTRTTSTTINSKPFGNTLNDYIIETDFRHIQNLGSNLNAFSVGLRATSGYDSYRMSYFERIRYNPITHKVDNGMTLTSNTLGIGRGASANVGSQYISKISGTSTCNIAIGTDYVITAAARGTQLGMRVADKSSGNVISSFYGSTTDNDYSADGSSITARGGGQTLLSYHSGVGMFDNIKIYTLNNIDKIKLQSPPKQLEIGESAVLNTLGITSAQATAALEGVEYITDTGLEVSNGVVTALNPGVQSLLAKYTDVFGNIKYDLSYIFVTESDVLEDMAISEIGYDNLTGRLNSGENASAVRYTVSVKLNKIIDKSVVLYLAVYDDDKLLSVSSDTLTIENPGEIEELQAVVIEPITEASEYRVFVWDKNTLKPLINFE